MNIIQSILIRNFESHKNTEIILGKGLNFFTGISDSGKSSIFRAVYWCLFNEPSGDSFRSHWGGKTKVKITFTDLAITRIRSNKYNRYILFQNGKNSIFDAVGSGVPEEIKHAIAMDEINFNMQLDSHFLLSLSPGDVGRKLNSFVDLQAIDLTLKKGNHLLKEVQTQIKFTVENIQDLKTRLDSVPDLSHLEKLVSMIEKIEIDIQQRERDILKLNILINNLKEIEQDIFAMDFDSSSATVILEQAFQLEKRIRQTQEKYKNLLYQLDIFGKAERQIKVASLDLEQALLLKKETFPKECPLCGAPKNWRKL